MEKNQWNIATLVFANMTWSACFMRISMQFLPFTNQDKIDSGRCDLSLSHSPVLPVTVGMESFYKKTIWITLETQPTVWRHGRKRRRQNLTNMRHSLTLVSLSLSLSLSLSSHTLTNEIQAISIFNKLNSMLQRYCKVNVGEREIWMKKDSHRF